MGKNNANGNLRIFGRLSAPLVHGAELVGNSADLVLDRAGNIVGTTMRTVGNVGRLAGSHANKAVHGLTGLRRSTRKNRRSSRKASRKNRRSSRRNH